MLKFELDDKGRMSCYSGRKCYLHICRMQQSLCCKCVLCCCRSLNEIKDREICCYSISCKERENIGSLFFCFFLSTCITWSRPMIQCQFDWAVIYNLCVLIALNSVVEFSSYFFCFISQYCVVISMPATL